MRIWSYNSVAGDYTNPANYAWIETSITVGSVGYKLFTKSETTGGANDYKLVFS
jgi:hypothetical protein